jgi:hypothetical protein
MRALLKSTICLSMLAFLAMPAQAAETPADFFFKPYVGADYQYTGVNYEEDIAGTGINGDDIANDSLHGVNLHVGARVHKHLGFEAGYLWSDEADKNNVLGTGINTKTSVKGFTFDALGYLPVDDAGRLELIGTVGISHLKGEVEASAPGLATGSVDDTETKPRFGGGAQYWLTDHLNVRGLVRYQSADFDGTVKDAVTANLGLNFQF